MAQVLWKGRERKERGPEIAKGSLVSGGTYRRTQILKEMEKKRRRGGRKERRRRG